MAEKKSAKNMFSNMWSIITDQKCRNFFLGTLILSLLVYSFFYSFWRIPFVDFGTDRMSVIQLWDYIFVLVVSIFVAVLITLARYEKNLHLQNESKYLGKGSSIFAAIIAAACPVCQGITIVALGSTILAIPFGFLSPYIGFFKVVSIAILALAVFFRADSVYTKTCPTIIPSKKMKKSVKSGSGWLMDSSIVSVMIAALVVLLALNQFLIADAYSFSGVGGGSGNVGSFTYGAKMTLKPVPLAQGEQPAISGYKSKVKPLPTISELQMKPATGDAVQDLVNNVVPSGTPWYGAEAGVSFDDPIAAQNLWGKGEAIQLDSAQEARWNRIVNSFTCDYCCGSPQNPTIITRCGCAHAKGARGMAKWFIKNYGDKYSDEEIYGEMARWYALWYPQGTVKRIIEESQIA